ncbi:hypothetical protein RRF57_004204 [Xylaria bambusicola]|uniref:Uncharacterized protein n=1 Tax=Xylaria bambusicola TaxID=326684 RepID=A0AAN7UVU6_9PEZI
MARHQRNEAGSEIVPSQSQGRSSSPQTSESGQVTPSSSSSPNTVDRRLSLPLTPADPNDPNDPKLHAVDSDGVGDGHGGETYELREFDGAGIRDAGEYGADADEPNENKNARMISGRRWNGNARRQSESTVASFQLYTPNERGSLSGNLIVVLSCF